MPFTRAFALISLLTGLLLSAAAAEAQESRLEKQALRCSSLFIIFAESHAENVTLVKTFQNYASIFFDLYTKEQAERNGKLNQPEAQQKRRLILDEIQATYKSRQALLDEEAILCGAWAEGYRLQGENVTYVPIIPKLIPQIVRDEYEAIAKLAFSRWIQ